MHDGQTERVDIFRVSRHGETFLTEANGILARRHARVFFQSALLHKGPGRVDLEGENSHVFLRRRRGVLARHIVVLVLGRGATRTHKSA
jgi:hypothetical protein